MLKSSEILRFSSDFLIWNSMRAREIILTRLSLVMSDQDLVSRTAGARRVHVRGESIVASAQRGCGNQQAGTHACAGDWRNKEREREREREGGGEKEKVREKNKKREKKSHWIIL